MCGANISLVPQALTGQLEAASDVQGDGRSRRRGRRGSRPPSLATGIQEITTGIDWIVVSLLVSRYAPAGQIWWFWLMIPAFIAFGRGIAEIVRLRQLAAATQISPQQMRPPSVRPESLPAARTGELLATPPSVTEGTTRHLGAEAATRHLDSSNEF